MQCIFSVKRMKRIWNYSIIRGELFSEKSNHMSQELHWGIIGVSVIANELAVAMKKIVTKYKRHLPIGRCLLSYKHPIIFITKRFYKYFTQIIAIPRSTRIIPVAWFSNLAGALLARTAATLAKIRVLIMQRISTTGSGIPPMTK